jgi:AraC-like DNA-binding protein
VGVDVMADILGAMRIGRPVAARTETHGPWGLRFNHITGAAFHVVLQGSCWLMPPPEEPATFEPVELGPGDVVLLGRGNAHVMASAPGVPLVDFAPTRATPSAPFGQMTLPGSGARAIALCGAYLLRRQRSHPLLSSLPDVLHLPARPGRHPALHALTTLLGEELENHPPGSTAVTPILVDALLVYMLRAWLHDATHTDGWSAALADPVTARALAAMHEHPEHPWTVHELGAVAGLSRAAFARRFTTLVGEPPLSYLTHWRMTTATRLLRDTDKPLTQLAEATGYGSAFAFAKAFRREYDMTPGTYRATARGAGV